MQSTGALGRLLRGLAHRGAASLLLVVIAVVAAGAAAAAPAYLAAARISVVQSTFAAAPTAASQLEVTDADAEAADPEVLAGAVDRILQSRAGAPPAAALFAPTVVGYEASLTFAPMESVPLVSRTGVCAHLHLVRGRCPQRPGEGLLSANAAATGPSVAQLAARGITVVGVYGPTDPDDPSWFGRYSQVIADPNGGASGATRDAVFVTQPTIAARHLPGTAVADVGLRATRLTPHALGAVQRAYTGVAADPGLQEQQVTVASTLMTTVAVVHQGWSSLAVPAVVAASSLLVLAWLLLFLVVTEDVETRGEEIALARLRGLGRLRVLAAGIAEPLVVLAAAVPVGVLAGWWVVHLLAGSLFGPGIPVGLPALSWGAAAVAVLGGLAAVLAASRRVFARAVLEQWRPTRQGGPRRGWAFDAVVVTAAAAGLVELGVSGTISSSGSGVQVELVPALIALAAAVVLSRLLPPLCRLAAVRTRRAGGLAAFLAVRHVARRPGGARSVMVLAAALAIALFGVAAWSVGLAARERVAAVTVGAPTVLTVAVPAGRDLAAIVDRVDPGGRRAVAVSTFSDGDQQLIAVEPGRFAAVASWAPGTPVAQVAHQLSPAASPPVVVDGDALRVHVTGAHLTGLLLSGQVRSALPGAPEQLGFSAEPGSTGTRGTYEASLTSCPCTLDQISVGTIATSGVRGTLVLTGVDVHGPGGWRPAGSAAVTSWQIKGGEVADVVTAGAAGLSWRYDTAGGGESTIESTDRPDPLPAVAADALVPAGGVPFTTVGLDTGQLDVAPVAVASSVPGAPANGVVVDRTYALRASGSLNEGRDQVWLAAGAGGLIPQLRAAGLTVLATGTTAALRTALDRQGPALATALLLFDSSVAAGLAAVGAIVSLVAAARRRRYEYAALIAAGGRRRLVWRSLALEQSIVLGYGVLVGLGAGLVGIALAVPKVPVLLTPPVAPALDLVPRVAPMLAAVGIVLLALALAALLSTYALMRTVRPSALREGMA